MNWFNEFQRAYPPKQITHIKDLEAVSQLCNTIKVQSTGRQLEVSMDSVQGHSHTHARRHTHTHTHTYTHSHTGLHLSRFFFFLKASGMFSGKSVGAVISCYVIRVTSRAVARGKSYKNSAKSTWVHLQGLKPRSTSTSVCLPSSHDTEHFPHLGNSCWALLLSLAYHRNTQKVNTHRFVTKNITGTVGFTSVWQLMLYNVTVSNSKKLLCRVLL